MKYFVSFNIRYLNGGQEIGNTEITIDGGIDSYDDIIDIQNKISTTIFEGRAKVDVIFFHPLKYV